jgi:bifunctional non-homologous end joining protein LigD
LRQLPIQAGVLVGEIVALNASGKPSFQDLQHGPAPSRGPRPIFFFAFDLLNLECKALLSLPLVQRKRLLKDILGTAPAVIRFLPSLKGAPDQILQAVQDQGLEGIVAKVTTSRYEPERRSGAWAKFKIGLEQEFVIGGYTRGRGGRADFGALIVGCFDQGKLRYASKVGTGFSDRQIRKIVQLGESVRQAECPFVHIPQSQGSSWSHGLTAAERRTAVWLRPVLVCRVRFTEWTRDGHLRHAIFIGLREDTPAPRPR